jgi:hypothetical protein
VLWISDNSSVLVEERSSGLLKGNAVLLLVSAVFPRIPNKQLQRTVIPNRWRAASASFHYAPAARWTLGRAAAELRRYTALPD